MVRSSFSIMLTMGILLTAGTAFSSDFVRYGRFDGPGETNAQDDLVINRPPNIQGLTGLMIMNTAFTQKAGKMALGISAMGENSETPNTSIAQGIGTLTIGITNSFELGVKGKVVATGLGSEATRKQGQGDAEVAVKWRIRNQSEEAIIPAIALGLAGILPTGDDTNGYAEVQKEGFKFMVIASAENRVLDDIFVGMHFEAQAVFIDQASEDAVVPTKEMYGVINAGLHFPFDETNHMQLMLEYNQVTKKDNPTLFEGNYKAASIGLRYVAKYLTMTVGGQFLNKEAVGFDDTIRFIGTMSVNY